jgi:4-amino-4-deoxy-L-arabinose transferase-like glycosyltransferase
MSETHWFRPTVILIALLTAFRVLTQYYADIDLFVDESQYWFWGQELAFGYYSKPPLIGWVIRLFTGIAGSDAPFWVRLPAPLFHAATALILAWVAAENISNRSAVYVAVGYATLPMIAVGSVLISTDTIMFPFLAASLGFYLRLCRTSDAQYALLAGALLGCAFMAKYAAVYFILCAGIAAVLMPMYRPSLKQVGFALVAFLIFISPNLIWNIANGFSTAQHTLDNADWVRDPSERASLNIAGLAEFVVSQFAVFGPVLFAALPATLVGLVARPKTSIEKLLLCFCVPIIALVSVQALLSQAYANWAATAYLAGTLLVVPILMRKMWVLSVAIGLNLIFCIMLPLATLSGSTLSLNGKTLLLERYVGIEALSLEIEQVAIAQGQTAIVAQNRDVLANLFYTLDRDTWTLASVPPQGRAPNHYALSYAWLPPFEVETVLAVVRKDRQVPCQSTLITTLEPTQGHYRGQTFRLYVVPADCWEKRRKKASQGEG